jgi:hypothetical protein
MPTAKRVFAVFYVADGQSEKAFYLYQRSNEGFQEYVVHTTYHNQPGFCNGGYYDNFNDALEDFTKRMTTALSYLVDDPSSIGKGLPTGLMFPRDF